MEVMGCIMVVVRVVKVVVKVAVMEKEVGMVVITSIMT